MSVQVHSPVCFVSSDYSVSLGLIITELVINALKYAFPEDAGSIDVTYKFRGRNWELIVRDDGIGMSLAAKPGLGTSIIEAIAQKLDAKIEVRRSADGTQISIIHTESEPTKQPLAV
jgi:two-component sensor histidine kinase